MLFCPECGANIFDLEQEFKRRQKHGIKKVSTKWQIFFSLIPFMPLVAAYRIRKLRKAIIIYSVAAALTLSAVLIFNGIVEYQYSNLQESSDPTVLEKFSAFSSFYDSFWKESFTYLLWTSIYLVSASAMVYFIRKWT
jgi:C4-dicarboxylate transporter